MKIDRLDKESLVLILSELISRLDKLDEEDFFGTEGWRHFLDMEHLL